MIESRREKLSNIKIEQAQHAGLWLDRYLCQQPERNERIVDEKGTPQTQLFEQAAGIPTPKLYSRFYHHWCAALAQADPVPLVAKARVDGRMIVGLGAESVLETSVTLHRTYGVPSIPGSALKGLTASFARQRLGSDWHPDGTAYQTMFGDTTSAGYITFFDALYVPGSGYNQQPLHPDVITVHHKKYYQDGAKLEPPADWDSPTPVPFLSATGSYLVAVSGPPDQDNRNGWAVAAMKLLRLALEEMGVGAKTSSGYGRLKFTEDAHPATAYESAASKKTGQETPPAPRIEPRLPTIGEKFRAEIDDIDDELGVVLLKLPASFEDAAGAAIPISPALREQTLVVIPPQHKTGGGYRPGNMRWVEVIGVRKQGKIVEVKPITKDAMS
jgi:CRISPR-associated protein Cmr6